MMKSAIILFAVVMVVGIQARNAPLQYQGVSRFEIKDEETRLFELLMSRNGLELTKPSSRLGSYVFKNCGDPTKDLADIKNITFGPDPISFPGDLDVSFEAQIKSSLDAPLKANVTLLRKFAGNWIKLPCIGNIGSCTYEDLCQLLSGAVCPPPFVTNKIPCKCPFPTGSYKLPKTRFEVLAAVFPPGDYHVTANLVYKTKAVACVDIMASFD